MLKFYQSFKDIDLEQLAQVYVDSIQTGDLFSSLNDFYNYWLYDFFCVAGATCAVWAEEGCYVSAMRIEPYKDGLLLTGLETDPQRRGQGMAGKLISAVVQRLKTQGCTRLYSHIQRKNIPSIRVHRSRGFTLILEHAVFLDGSVSQTYDTYMLEL